MKKEYPKFARFELQKIKKKLSAKNKKLINDFIKECSGTAGDKKLKKIDQILIQVAYVIEKDLDKLEREDITQFFNLLNNSGRTAWTRNEIKIYLKKYILWKYGSTDLMKGIKQVSLENAFNDHKINESAFLEPEEIEKLLRGARDILFKTWLMLQIETGARTEELIKYLKWKHIHFGKEGITDITLYSNKTGKTRTFPVKKSTILLKEYKQHYPYANLKPEDYVFPSPRDREKPITIDSLAKRLKRLAERVGINKNCFPYLFRHQKLTQLYEELPTPIVEKLAGHKGMSHIYAHISSKKAREEMLNKIYKIEELTEEEREEITKLKESVKLLQEDVAFLKDVNKNLMVSYGRSDRDHKKEIDKIARGER